MRLHVAITCVVAVASLAVLVWLLLKVKQKSPSPPLVLRFAAFGLFVACLYFCTPETVSVIFLSAMFGGLALYREARRFYLGLPTDAVIEAKLRSIQLVLAVQLLTPSNTGLVLAGGGGKGAYQVGALLALREIGIHRFAGVAGTSVGALNGALVAQGGLDDAKMIWRTIKPQRVLSFKWVMFPFAVAGRLLIFPFYLLWGALGPWDHLRQYLSFKKVIETGVKIVVDVVFGLIIVGLMVLIIGWERVKTEGSFWAFFQEAYLAYAALLLALVWFLLEDAHSFLADKFSLLSNRPLQELVASKLNVERIKQSPVPIFVTHAASSLVLRREERSPEQVAASIAERAKILAEPESADHSAFAGTRATRAAAVNTAPYAIDRELGFKPQYVDLRLQSPAAIREFVLQSAGLPEIFPRRNILGQSVVDGGVADNEPFAPLLRQPEVQNIIAIYLEPKDLPGERGRLRRLAAERYVPLPGSDDEEGAAWNELAANGPILSRSVSVLPIIPSRSLGGLIFGTLSFSAKKAEALIRLGKWDALNAVERGLETFPSYFSHSPPGITRN